MPRETPLKLEVRFRDDGRAMPYEVVGVSPTDGTEYPYATFVFREHADEWVAGRVGGAK